MTATLPLAAAPPAPERERAGELLLLCARTRLTPDQHQRAEQLLAGPVDWSVVLQQAQRHRTWPLLYRHLCGDFKSVVPAGVRERLGAYGRKLALFTLQQTQEMIHLMRAFEGAGIQALPFKGPVLGVQVYGDATLRQFGDLDVLVPRADVPRAEQLLAGRGYAPYKPMTAAEAERYLDIEKSREYVGERGLVELHWNFMHPMHGLQIDAEAVRRRTAPLTVGGATVPAPSPEDLLVYLCAHGSKHFWERLSWICDVAECLRTYKSEMNWAVALARADELHARRMLLLGLRLAARLLEAPVPAELLRRAAASAAVNQLTATVCGDLFLEPEDAEARFDEAGVEMKHARFHLLMRERVRDRLPYYRHLAQLAVTPTPRDRALLPLPPRLSFLYYVLRPFRLMRDTLTRTAPAGD